MPALRLSIEPSGAVVMVRIIGSLRESTLREAQADLEPLVHLQPQAVLLDLRGVHDADLSGGLGLVKALRPVQKRLALLPSEPVLAGALREALAGISCYDSIDLLLRAEDLTLPAALARDAERRRAVRHRLRLSTELMGADGQLRAGWTVDLSRTGARVCAHQSETAFGEPVALRLSLATVPVRVARVLGLTPPTWGLEFTGALGAAEQLFEGLGA